MSRTDLTSTWTPRRIKTGCLGWIMGVTLSDNGATVLCYGDVHGLWKLDRATNTWKYVLTPSRMTGGFFAFGQTGWNAGAIGVCVAPSDPNRAYATIGVYNCEPEFTAGGKLVVFGGLVLRSDDAGETWSRTALPLSGTMADGGNYQRWNQQKIAVDPFNADVVIAGFQYVSGDPDFTGKTYITTNGGTSWTQLTAIPVPATGSTISGIFFDRSTLSGGRCQTIYIVSNGNGIYKSTNAGTSWSLWYSTTSNVYSITQSLVNNTIWCCTSTGSLRWSPGASSPTSVSADAVMLLPHPTSGTTVLAINAGGFTSICQNATTTPPTFSAVDQTDRRRSTLIPIMINTNEIYMTTAGAVFDPIAVGGNYYVFLGAGIGVWRSTNPVPTSGSYLRDWTEYSAGLELLVSTDLICTPRGRIAVSQWDRGAIARHFTETNNYASRHGTANWLESGLIHSSTIDYASTDTDCIITPGFFPFGNQAKGATNWEDASVSRDGGRTWTRFPRMPAWWDNQANTTKVQSWGCMAASTPHNWIWQPAYTGVDVASFLGGVDRLPYYTLDGGNSWHPCLLPGIGTSTDVGSDWAEGFASYLYSRRPVAADRVQPNRFLYFLPNHLDSSKAGVFLTTDGGKTWTRKYTGWFDGYGGLDATSGRLKAVHGKAGHYAWTPGSLGGDINGRLWLTQDEGFSWNAIGNLWMPIDFSFGAINTAGGFTYNRLWSICFAEPTDNHDYVKYGVYYTDNCLATNPDWFKVGDYIEGWTDGAALIAASLTSLDVVYMAHSRSGTSMIYRTAAGAFDRTAIRV